MWQLSSRCAKRLFSLAGLDFDVCHFAGKVLKELITSKIENRSSKIKITVKIILSCLHRLGVCFTRNWLMSWAMERVRLGTLAEQKWVWSNQNKFSWIWLVIELDAWPMRFKTDRIRSQLKVYGSLPYFLALWLVQIGHVISQRSTFTKLFSFHLKFYLTVSLTFEILKWFENLWVFVSSNSREPVTSVLTEKQVFWTINW